MFILPLLFNYVYMFYKNYFIYIVFFFAQVCLCVIVLLLGCIQYKIELTFNNLTLSYYLINLYILFYNKTYLSKLNTTLTTNIYLFTNYLLCNNYNYKYVFEYLNYFFKIVLCLLKWISQTISLIFNIKNLWYPLFKKYSYFGYSRFTRFSQNRFFKK